MGGLQISKIAFGAVIRALVCLQVEKFNVAATETVFLRWTIAFKANRITGLATFTAIEITTRTRRLALASNKSPAG